MIDTILDLIASAIEFVVDFIIDIIEGVISFWNDVVDYFKKLNLTRNANKNVFIADANKFRDILHGAPVVDAGIFGGVYNEETNEIENGRFVGGDALDEKTKSVIGEKGIAILT